MSDPWEAQREALGSFIHAQRKMANLSLRQLAELTSLSNPYLSQLERGLHQPSVRVLKLISDALNVSAETLLTEACLITPARPAPGETGSAARRRGRDQRRRAPFGGPEVRAHRRLPEHAAARVARAPSSPPRRLDQPGSRAGGHPKSWFRVASVG